MSIEVEQTLKRIQSHRGVQGILIADGSGRTIKTTMNAEEANRHASILTTLTTKAKSAVRELDERNKLTFMSLKTSNNEIMIAVDAHDQFLLIVLQNSKISRE